MNAVLNKNTQTCHLAESNLLVGLPWCLSGKVHTCQYGRRTFDPWVGKIPWRKEMATRSSILDWEIPWTEEVWHAWGCKESRHNLVTAAAAAKSLQSCPTLCDPTDGSPPGSPVPGILQARTPECVAISFSNAWKWSLSVMSDSSRPHGLQPTRLICPWDFPGKSTGVGCHCLLQLSD